MGGKDGAKDTNDGKSKKDHKDQTEDENDEESTDEKHEKDGAKDEKDRTNKKDHKDNNEDLDDRETEDQNEDKNEDEESKPFMFASFQIVSLDAMKNYVVKSDDCKEEAKYRKWSPDNFMQKCMDYLAVSSFELSDTLMDSKCKEITCADPWAAVFRDNFYTKDAWLGCLHKALGN